MPFKCKTKVFIPPIADVVEKVMKEEMSEGCIVHRVVKEVLPKTNNIPFFHGGLHHASITGEPIRQVSTQVLNPDRFEDLASVPDDV